MCIPYWTFGETLVSVCQSWQLSPVISPVNLSRFSAGWEALAGRWWGAERKLEINSSLLSASHALSPKVPLHPYFHSYSQIRAVIVNEGIFPFVFPAVPLIRGIFLSREKQHQRDRKRGFEVNVKHTVVLFKKNNSKNNHCRGCHCN